MHQAVRARSSSRALPGGQGAPYQNTGRGGGLGARGTEAPSTWWQGGAQGGCAAGQEGCRTLPVHSPPHAAQGQRGFKPVRPTRSWPRPPGPGVRQVPKERECLLSAARPQPRWPLECGRRGRHGPRQARAALPPRSPLSLARTGGAAALRLREQQKRRRPWSLLPRVRRRRPPGSGADDVPWAASVRKSHMAACSLYVSGLPPLTL